MVYGFVLLIHILVCFVLIAVILLQGGRGGLSEALGGAAAQSLFGGSATSVLTKVTGACAVGFVVTCLSLAYLSTVRGRSIMERFNALAPENAPFVPPTIPTGPDAAPPSSETQHPSGANSTPAP